MFASSAIMLVAIPKVPLFFLVPVSLSRSGIPRVIPPVLRKVLSRRDSHADMLVRLYLSWFGLSKFIAVAPRVRK